MPSPSALRMELRQCRALVAKCVRTGCGWGRPRAVLGFMLEFALVPLLFILVMQLPRHFVDDVVRPPLASPRVSRIDDAAWATSPTSILQSLLAGLGTGGMRDVYSEELHRRMPRGSNEIVFLVDDGRGAADALMNETAKAVACAPGDGLPRFFTDIFLSSYCQLPRDECRMTEDCWLPLKETYLRHAAPEEEQKLLEQIRRDGPRTRVSAIVAVEGALPHSSMTRRSAGYGDIVIRIRMNVDDVVDVNVKLKYMLELSGPPEEFRQYWYFLNLEKAVLEALERMSVAPFAAEEADATGWGDMPTLLPAVGDVKVSSFPWPKKVVPMATVYSAALFRLLIIFVFVIPFRFYVVSLMREKESRQKDCLLAMGVRTRTYYASWYVAHVVLSGATTVTIAISGTWPFPLTSPVLMLGVYTAVSMSLISFAYLVQAFFLEANLCLLTSLLVYFAAALPGYVSMRLAPYDGSSRWWSCLLPPSAIAVLAEILLTAEAANSGLQLHSSITVENSISTRDVICMLLADSCMYFLAGIIVEMFGHRAAEAVVRVMTATTTGTVARVRRFVPTCIGTYIFRLPARQPTMARDSMQLAETYTGTDLPAAQIGIGHRGHVPNRPQTMRERGDDERLHRKMQGCCRLDGNDGVHGAVAVECVDVSKEYFSVAPGVPSRRAVTDVSFKLRAGAITALLGNNGCGKTTLLSMMSGRTGLTAGRIVIQGRTIVRRADFESVRHRFSVCPQHDAHWPSMSVREHLQLAVDLKPCCAGLHEGPVQASKRQQRLAIDSLLTQFGLLGKQHHRAGRLSGGEQRKVTLMLAVIGDPEILILDEPTNNMDPESRIATWKLLAAIIRGDSGSYPATRNREPQRNRTVLLTTHSMAEASALSDDIIIIDGGRLVAHERRARLLREYGGAAGILVALPRIDKDRDCILSPGRPRCRDRMLRILCELPCGDDIVTSVEDYGDANECVVQLRPGIGVAEACRVFDALEGARLRGVVESIRIVSPSIENAFRAITAPGVCSPDECATDGASARLRGTMGEAIDRKKVSATAGPLSGLCARIRVLVYKRLMCSWRDAASIAAMVLAPSLFAAFALACFTLATSEESVPTLPLARESVMAGRPPFFGWMATGDVISGAKNGTHDWDDGEMRQRIVSEYDRTSGSAAERIPYRSAHFSTVSQRQREVPVPVSAPGNPVERIDVEDDGPPVELHNDNLHRYLLRRWYDGGPEHFDYVLLSDSERHDDIAQGKGRIAVFDAVIGCNQSTPHALPSSLAHLYSVFRRVRALSSDNSTTTSGQLGKIMVYNDPYGENTNQNRMGRHADIVLLASMIIAVSTLSASTVIGAVRERASGFHRLQELAGASGTVLALVNCAYEYAMALIAVSCMLVVFYAFDVEPFSGDAILGIGSLMVAFLLPGMLMGGLICQLVRFTTSMDAYCVLALVYFAATMATCVSNIILDTVSVSNDEARRALRATSLVFPAMLPHYSVVMGIYDIGHRDLHRTSVWDYEVTGRHIGWLVGMTPVLLALVALAAVAPRISVIVRALRRVGASSLRIARENEQSDGVSCTRSGDSGADGEDAKLWRMQSATTGDVLAHGVDGAGDEHCPLSVRELAWGGCGGGNDGINFAMRRGEIFGLLGSNGAGKSTILKCVTGSLPPRAQSPSGYSGSVLVRGEAVKWMGAGGIIGYCPQGDPHIQCLTTEEHLSILATILRPYEPRREVLRRVRGAMNAVGLRLPNVHEEGRLPTSALSGGTLRKLSIAMALLLDRGLLLLDEPSVGLDTSSRRHLWDFLRRRACETSILLTTHDIEEIESVCHRFGILRPGMDMCVGAVDSIVEEMGIDRFVLAFRSGVDERGRFDGCAGGTEEAFAGRIASFLCRLCPDLDIGCAWAIQWDGTARQVWGDGNEETTGANQYTLEIQFRLSARAVNERDMLRIMIALGSEHQKVALGIDGWDIRRPSLADAFA